MKKLLHSILFKAVCLAALACAIQIQPGRVAWAADAVQSPLVLVLPFQVNAGPEMPDASRDVPRIIATQLEQNGLKVVPMSRARELQRRGGETIDLATARRLGRQAGAKLVIYGSFNQLGDGFTMDTRDRKSVV